LVRTAGTLTEIFRSPRGIALLLREGDQLLRAEIPLDPETPPPSWTAGSRVEVTGVSMELVNESRLPASEGSPPVLHLLVHDADDVVLLDAASWWTPGRLRLLAGATAVALAAAFAWGTLLRRQVRRRTRQLSD